MAQQPPKRTNYNGSKVKILIPKLDRERSSLCSSIEECFKKLEIPYKVGSDNVKPYRHNFIICIDNLRLEEDVRNTVKQFPRIAAKKYCTCIIYLRNVEEVALTTETFHTYELFKGNEYLQEFGSIIDCVYRGNFDIYACEVNTKAGELIYRFLNRVKTYFTETCEDLQLQVVTKLGLHHSCNEHVFVISKCGDTNKVLSKLGLQDLNTFVFICLQHHRNEHWTEYKVDFETKSVNVIYLMYNDNLEIHDCDASANSVQQIRLLLNNVTTRYNPSTCPVNLYDTLTQLVGDELRTTPVLNIDNQRYIFVICYTIDTHHELTVLKAKVKEINPQENYCRYVVLRSDSDEIGDHDINSCFQDGYLDNFGSVINCIYNTANKIYDCNINFEARLHIRQFFIREEMGSGQSKAGNILPTPWRDIGCASHDAWFRDSLIEAVKGTTPKCEISNMNIAIIGKIGAGKSSFINTISSVAEEYVSKPARTGPKSKKSVTTKYNRHKIDFGTSHAIWLCDTRGVDYDFDLKSQDLEYLLKGHIKDGYVFDASKTIQPGDEHFEEHPKKDDKIHCVCFVFDATALAADKVLPYKRFLNKISEESELRTVTVLTKMDMVCEDVLKNVSNMYKSKRADDLVKLMASKLEIDTNDIVPVVNYIKQTENDISIDISALLALRQMLRRCRDFTSIAAKQI